MKRKYILIVLFYLILNSYCAYGVYEIGYSVDNIIHQVKRVEKSIENFKYYGGCWKIFSKIIQEANQVDQDVDSYLFGVSVRHDIKEFVYINEKVKERIQEFIYESNYIFNQCRDQDDTITVSPDLQLCTFNFINEFLQQWEPTLHALRLKLDSAEIKPNVRITLSSKLNSLSKSKLKEAFYKFKDCENSYCIDLVVIPRGTFKMGSIDSSKRDSAGDRINQREIPIHTVKIERPFAIGLHEVTLKQFSEFVKETGYKVPNGCLTLINYSTDIITSSSSSSSNSNSSSLSTVITTIIKFNSTLNYKNPGEDFQNQSNHHPIVCIRKIDAQEFAKWLSGKTNQKYRLPSEAEWEYAARSQSGYNKYIWGNGTTDACQYGNFYDLDSNRYFKFSILNFNCSDSSITTQRVASYKANQFRLFDIQGNVNEYVGDRDGVYSVVKGSSWASSPNVYLSNRELVLSQHKSTFTGFRLVREISFQDQQFNNNNNNRFYDYIENNNF